MLFILATYIKNTMEEYTTLFNSESEITRIIHISDIHIRNIERHDEYIDIFNKLYSKISKIKSNFLIVIAGDIMHFKTTLSPESVKIAYEFFTSLERYAPVIVIPGNHDFNTSNKNRLDALTPILKNIGEHNERIHYLKYSGYYRYENIMFSVSSIFDGIMLKKPDWDEFVHVALYHGDIERIKMEDGRTFIAELKKYDFAMLGDIHERKFMNTKKSIAYAGSLIQQNHGESIGNHGYIDWDLNSRKGRFINVSNDYCFCSINVKDGEYECDELPRNVRIRFIIENTSEMRLIEIEKELKEKYNVIGIVKAPKLNQIREIANSSNDDQYDKYMVDYLTEKHSKHRDAILELHRKIQDEVKKNSLEDDCTYCSKRLTVHKLSFSNMLSYGKNNEIDFSKYGSNKIVGIVAPNHYGKSAIIDILLFAFFDKYSRGERKDIMNKNRSQMHCCVDFSVENQMYRIERNGTKKNNLVSIDVHFYKLNGENSELINGIDKNETNRLIKTVVGDYGYYLLTNVCLQNTDDNFIEMTNLKKVEFLDKMLGITEYSKCYDYAKKKSADMEIEMKTFSKILESKNFISMTEQLKSMALEINELNKELTKVDENINSIETIHNTISIPYLLKEYAFESIDDIKTIRTKLTKSMNGKILVLIDDTKSEYSAWKKLNDIDLINKKIKAFESKIINVSECAPVIDTRDEIHQRIECIDREMVCVGSNDMGELVEKKKRICDRIEILKKSIDYSVDEYNPNQMELFRNVMLCSDEMIEFASLKDFTADRFLGQIDILDDIIESVESVDMCRRYTEMKKDVLKKLDIVKKGSYENSKRKHADAVELLQKCIRDNGIYQSNELIKLEISELENELNVILREMCAVENNSRLMQERGILVERIEIINEKISMYEKYTEITEKNNRIKKILKKYDEKRITMMKEEEEYDNRIKTLEIESKENDIIRAKLTELDAFESEFVVYAGKEEMKKINEEKRVSLEKTKKAIELKLNTLRTKSDMIKADVIEYTTVFDKYNALLIQVDLYNNYLNFTHTNGFPYHLLKQNISIIENEVNRVLEIMAKFKIELAYDDILRANENKSKEIKSTKGCIVVSMKYPNTNPYNVSNASGFETFVINLAFRLAFSNISCNTKPDLFIIDEGFSCMDDTNKSNVSELMEFLRTQFELVITVSHLDELKNQHDYSINIDKIGGFSCIV